MAAAARPHPLTDRDVWLNSVLRSANGATAPVVETVLAMLTMADIERLAPRLGRSQELLVADRAAARVRISALLGG
jgi:hypothetical protein